RPERHHLHVTSRTCLGHRVLVESAFDLDETEHQLRVEARPLRLVVHGHEEILAGDVVGNVPFESLRHLRQPRRAFGLRLESQLWTGAIGDGAMHDRLYTRGQGFVSLFTRETGLRRKDAGCQEREWS